MQECIDNEKEGILPFSLWGGEKEMLFSGKSVFQESYYNVWKEQMTTMERKEYYCKKEELNMLISAATIY